MIRLFLDSGAYSAWRRGGSLDLDEYVTFVRKNENLLDCYVSLDVIPGCDGQRERRPEHIERAAAQSYRNFQKMKQAGLAPMPVVREGERDQWLKRYLDEGTQAIALSVKGSYDAMLWLDDAFAVLAHYPSVKVHGLSATSPALLHRYRFNTVDSATWIKQAAAGQIPLPRYSNGRPNYSLRHQTTSVTDRAFARSNHVEDLTQFERERLNHFLNEEVGIDLAQARESPQHRWRCWLLYFRGLSKSSSTEIVFVTSAIHKLRDLLVQHGFRRHLISYHKVRNMRANALQEYVLGSRLGAGNTFFQKEGLTTLRTPVQS